MLLPGRLIFFASLAAATQICPLCAAVTGIINGDFETDGLAVNAEVQSITSWFESATPGSGGYQDWLMRNSSTTTFAGNTTTVAAFSATTGYIYQQIGTYTAGEQVTLTGLAMKRAAIGSQFTGVTIELLAGNFSGADGTLLTATVLDTEVLTAAGLGLPTSGATAGSSPFTVVLDSGTSGVEGTALWIRLSKPNAGGEVFLDNLAAVPEPSLALLGAMGLIGGCFRRRR